MLNPSLFQPALGSCCRSVWLPFLRVRHSLVFLLSCAFGDIASRLRAKGAEHKLHQTCHQQQPSPCCEDVLPAPVCLCLLRQGRMRETRWTTGQATMSSESVLVVWLDEIRWFLEDMNLTEFALVSLGKKRRRLPNFASALPWLLSVSAAKQRGLLGGFEEITTGEERTECIEHQWGAVVVDDAWSPPILGYLQPPVVAILPADTRHQGLLSSLERLRFHCGGQIYVFHAEAPPREGFRLDGSFGWSKSCKHVERCHCPRTPVSPYGAWGWRLWRSFHRQLPQVWHLHTLDQWPAVAQSVTVVVFHFVRGKAKVLKFWRDPTAGGHFTGWSVPGGSIATGKDSGLWCTARREWNEETVGYPWEMAVGDALSEERSECIEGSWVYRSGRCLLCIANLGEVLLARDQWSDEVFSNGWSPRSNATVYAPAKPDFYGKGAALPLQRPERCVTPGTLQQSRRKIHTEGWPFIEHSGEAHWVDWDAEEEGAGIFPTMQSRNLDEPPAELLIFRRRCFIQDLRSRLRIDSRRFPSRNFYNEVTYYSLTSLPMQEQLWIVSDSVAAVSLSFQVDFSYEAGAENILSFKAMLKG
ncbi:unnamed protein product [Cladocopium goreaui]|uniref:Alpha-protein kinase 1 n=1 Tax=Cladocopium goreaui TaxID=2562237 RepID=A0A9P1CEQ7_9DINO|nr:unnamed protein product [Cladocopium goreaui]